MAYDIEGGNSQNLLGDYLSVQIRHGFIRKVYSLLFTLLCVTFGVGYATSSWVGKIASGSSSDSSRQLFGVLMIASFIAYIGLAVVASCFPAVLRKSPQNYCILGGFSVTLGFMLGITTAAYSLDVVLGAAGLTAVIVASLTAFAFQTKYDFTGKASYIFGISVALFCVMIMSIFFRGNSVVATVVAALTLIAFSIFLVYDTQLIVGGKHRQNELSVDDYAAATLLLYLDIINIFQALLKILAALSQNDR